MDRKTNWIVFGLTLTLVASPLGAADKEKPDDKYVSAGTVTGRVLSVGSNNNGLTIEIQVPVPDPNGMAQAARLRQQLMFARSPQERFNLMNQLARQQTMRMEMRPLELEPGENMVVRAMQPPVAFDEKGDIKKYTAKELKELKGDDPKQPGYASDYDSIKIGQIVQVSLLKKKPEGKPKVGKKEDMEFLNEERPVVKSIMIVAEPMN